MANQSQWQEAYWLPLLQLYLRKPVGMKPLYSRPMIDLALELNVAPKQLYEQMKMLDKRETASLQQLWKRFATHQKQLRRDIETIRKMRGFNHPQQFYDGVSQEETWQTDFRPLQVDADYHPRPLFPTDAYHDGQRHTRSEGVSHIAKLKTRESGRNHGDFPTLRPLLEPHDI